MASVSTYLNFPGNTEDAFNFYKTVFGGEFFGMGIMRFKDIPHSPDNPHKPDTDGNMVMHVELRILDSHTLMGTDAPESMGFKVNFGNNSYINLQPDTRKETKELFDKLSAGGKVSLFPASARADQRRPCTLRETEEIDQLARLRRPAGKDAPDAEGA